MASEQRLHELVELQRRRVAERNSAQLQEGAEQLRNQRRQHQGSCMCGASKPRVVSRQDVRRAQQKAARSEPTISTAASEGWEESVL